MPGARYQLQALLHDAAEAYIGDVIRPLKHQVELAGFRRIEADIESKIYKRFSVKVTKVSTQAVKNADDRILVDEVRRLSCRPDMYSELRGVRPLGVQLRCWEPSLAESMFLHRFRILYLGEEYESANA
jgi:hypothetical protein